MTWKRTRIERRDSAGPLTPLSLFRFIFTYLHTSAYVSIRQHALSIRCAYVEAVAVDHAVPVGKVVHELEEAWHDSVQPVSLHLPIFTDYVSIRIRQYTSAYVSMRGEPHLPIREPIHELEEAGGSSLNPLIHEIVRGNMFIEGDCDAGAFFVLVPVQLLLHQASSYQCIRPQANNV